MPPDQSVDQLEERDRFLQWDLVTVTPWGAPSIAPVGARLAAAEGRIWTSTAAGYGAKLRNISAHPRVSLLRCRSDGTAVLLRGEAELIGGDGTANLARLFGWMEGPGGSRGFYADTVESRFWGRLYREYWRRVLISVRVVEVLQLGHRSWRSQLISEWAQPSAESVPVPRPRLPDGRLRPGRDRGGRGMIEDGLPTVLAAQLSAGEAPMAWPVTVRSLLPGSILLVPPVGFPRRRLQRASLAVRMVDDSFEVARMAGWIGSVETGAKALSFVPRSEYGFSKPPGMLVDLAAGVATASRAFLGDVSQVSVPNLALASSMAGFAPSGPLQLDPRAWLLIEELFLRRTVLAPWYASLAAISEEASFRSRLTTLSRRSELERDWAHGLMARGKRRVGPIRLARAALRLPVIPLAPKALVRRQERQLQGLQRRLRALAQANPAIAPLPVADQQLRVKRDSGPGRQQALGRAAGAVLWSGAAALDRLGSRRR